MINAVRTTLLGPDPVRARLFYGAAALILALGATFYAGNFLHHSPVTPQQASHASGVDVGFAQYMAMHHDQAVVMSNIVRGRASGLINAFADSIASDQLLEIGELKGWLKLWNQPQLPGSAAMDWMTQKAAAPSASGIDYLAYLSFCRSTAGGMPGLATITELNALRNASGAALDILFLQLMLRHHQGALPMARYASEYAQSDVVRAAAAGMVFGQRQEIQKMRSLLLQHETAPLPFPNFNDT